ncbi:PQ loop repeat domain-containing protein [Hirsutella rhossiliensis]|uniref:PQ loop repeat domain-containing protein n=1 Tax=Hirsutella rhossiliensis TaxID=111463 RepID=A0A9P8MRJ5_9HYPO|nr:PQ loop repeat domain-containing protein [Hirsutella rhossiliensis]KAH0959174.1 PQ loop repeat domain-containing protein [Hirsutella rhossiliensis]
MAPPAPTFGLDVDAISGICGSISIACWVVVFSPQIIQQFRQGNADGLSIQFIIIWLLGDVFNIAGAVLQGVLPTMIILAIYYTLADIVLLGQCFYYRGFTWRDEAPSPRKPAAREPDERTTLLPGDALVEPRASDWTGLSPAVDHVSEAPEPRAPPSALQSAAWNATIVAMVCAAGVFGWFLATGGRATSSDRGADDGLELDVLGQVFGYLCAVAYIASRMPQLVLNWRRKTTDGLSMLFFLFACLGNVTYVLSIFAYDPKCPGRTCAPGEAAQLYGRYMLVNLSWLAGSLVTLLMDLTVFVQYFAYRTDNGQGQPREQNGRRDGASRGEERWDRPLLERSDTSN